MRISPVRFLKITRMAVNPNFKLICSSTLSMLCFRSLHPLTCTLSCSRWRWFFPASRPIHKGHTRAPSTLTLPLHPVPHLVHTCPAIPCPPTRNRLPVHGTSALRRCLQPIRLSKGTRRHRLCRLQQLGHQPKSPRRAVKPTS